MTPFTPDQKVLEVGGGAAPMFHPNMDVRQLPEVDIVANLSEKWPVEDATYDGVFSKFVIEHVSWRKVPHFVSELLRVLKPGGTAFVIAPNTEAQMKWALEQGDAYDKISQCLFGDLDYDENSHKAAFNPAFSIKLFRDAGFEGVAVLPFGELKTDMIIEARKAMPKTNEPLIGANLVAHAIVPGPDAPASLWTPEIRREAYNRHYFDGGRGKVGGYSREGYWDYPVHWLTFDKIMAEKPESVLELGCARGYLLKRLQDAGLRAAGLEVSEHCYLTRVCNDIQTWDLTQTPWPFKDQEFDLCVSIAVLEHIPESSIDAVAAEIRRVSKRGLHGVDFGDHDDGFDKTHCLFRDQCWWLAKLNNTLPVTGPPPPYAQAALEKDELERGDIKLPMGTGIKLNCGSYRTMFHHGWYNIDVHDLDGFAKQYGFNYRAHDLTKGIPAADGVVDLIYACHFLEHLNYEQGLAFLKEARRVMKPGGVIRIVVPDVKILAQNYIDGTLFRFDEISSDECVASPYGARKFWQLLASGHQAAYDHLALLGMLADAGFKTMARSDFNKSQSSQMQKETYDMFPEFSLFVEAVV